MEEDEIITIESLFIKYSCLHAFKIGDEEYLVDEEDFKKALIEFAKYNIKKALKSASEKIISDAQEQYGSSVPDCWSIDSILSAYNEDLIK